MLIIKNYRNRLSLLRFRKWGLRNQSSNLSFDLIVVKKNEHF